MTEDTGYTLVDGVPFSSLYGDTYFSKDGGLSESRFVFLAGNNLARRFSLAEKKGRESGRKQNFAVLELGFGTGLNFTAVLDLFYKLRLTMVRLDFWSLEKHPLAPGQLLPVIAGLDVHQKAKQWTRHYTPPQPGIDFIYNIDVAENIRLNLICYDAAKFFKKHSPRPYFDAVFLDGFAPRVEDGLWDYNILKAVSQRTLPGGSFATYTTARAVRDSLTRVGFLINRQPGFANKRSMLVGVKPGPQPVVPPPAEVAVIGAGLAGAATAYALARRGIKVTVYEKENAPAQGASGNPRALIKAPIRFAYRDPGHLREFFTKPQPRFALQAFLFALHRVRLLHQSAGDGINFIAASTLMIPPEDDSGRAASRWDKQAGYQTTTSIEKPLDGFVLQSANPLPHPNPDSGLQYLACGGSLDPAGLCRSLLAEPGITLKTGHTLKAVHRTTDWQLAFNDGRTGTAGVLVAANSFGINLIAGVLDKVPVATKWGRLWFNENKSGRAVNTFFSRGYTVNTGEIELIGSAALPATGSADETEPESFAEAEELLYESAGASLKELSGITYPGKTNQNRRQRTSRRCQGSDHRPVFGKWPDKVWLKNYGSYQKLKSKYGNRLPLEEPDAWQPGLYTIIGLGARGVIYSLYLGELLAGEISGEAVPATDDMRGDLNLYRFMLRDLKRGLL